MVDRKILMDSRSAGQAERDLIGLDGLMHDVPADRDCWMYWTDWLNCQIFF